MLSAHTELDLESGDVTPSMLNKLKDANPELSRQMSLAMSTMSEPESERTPLMAARSPKLGGLAPLPALELVPEDHESDLAPLFSEFATPRSPTYANLNDQRYILHFLDTNYSSARAEVACSFQYISNKAVAVTTSARVEKMCSFLHVQGQDASGFNSRRAEKQCSFLNTVPSTNSARAFTSGLAEKCTFMRSEPVKAVSVVSSGRLENSMRELPKWEEDESEEEWMEPLIESHRDATAKPRVNPTAYQPHMIAGAFSSNVVEKMTSFLSSEPSKAVSVTSSGRVEKMCSFQQDTPSKAVSTFSSGRAEKQCNFMTSEPSKAVSVFSSGRAERVMSELPAWEEDEEEWSFLPMLDGTEEEMDMINVKQYPDMATLWGEAFKDFKAAPEIDPTAEWEVDSDGNGGEPSPEMSPEARKVTPRNLL